MNLKENERILIILYKDYFKHLFKVHICCSLALFCHITLFFHFIFECLISLLLLSLILPLIESNLFYCGSQFSLKKQ